jgi:undecaprenyl-diphosphatase
MDAPPRSLNVLRVGRLLSAWAIALVAALALSALVAVDDVLPGEVRLLREIQTWDWFGGAFADVVRFVTGTQVVLITGAVVAATLFLLGERRAAIALVLALIVLSILQPAIKEIVDRPRPTDDLVDIRGGITSPSFPSGHVMSPTVLYGVIIAFASVRLRWRAIARAGVVGACTTLLVVTGAVNLYLGVHWPTDVIGGWLWGAVVASFALIVVGRINDRV